MLVRLCLCLCGLMISSNAAAAVPDCPGASVVCRETAREAPSFEQRADDKAGRDAWWAADKAKHAGVSFLLTLSNQYVLEKKGLSEDAALPLSIVISAAAGLGKELYDRRTGPAYRFSARDLAADGVGIALAVGVILL